VALVLRTSFNAVSTDNVASSPLGLNFTTTVLVAAYTLENNNTAIPAAINFNLLIILICLIIQIYSTLTGEFYRNKDIDSR
jgi:hypothetical protein